MVKSLTQFNKRYIQQNTFNNSTSYNLINQTLINNIIVECNYSSVINSNNQCNFATKYCDGTYFNLHKIHYCNLNSNYYITIPIVILSIIAVFYFMSDTANRYLSASLTKISKKLKLSESLSGMTLIALGNGAPDIISSLVAIDDDVIDNHSLDMSIGAILGAGMVVSALVFSLVILFNKPKNTSNNALKTTTTKEIQVNAKMFLRELIVYFISLIIFGLITYDNKVELYESVLFLALYFINLIIALLIEKYEISKLTNILRFLFNCKKHKNLSSSNYIRSSKINIININKTQNEGISNDKRKNKDNLSYSTHNTDVQIKSDSFEYKKNELNKIDFNCLYENEEIIINNKSNKTNSINSITKIEKDIKHNNNLLFLKFKKHYFNEIIEFSNVNIFRKLFYLLIELPLILLRDLSIPSCEENTYNKYVFSFFPFFSSIVILTFTKSWLLLLKYPVLFIIFLIIVILCCVYLFYITSKINSFFIIEKNTLSILIICVLNFALSILWIWTISNILVDIINFIGVLFNINSSYLGLTLLSIGNSASDLGLNISLARNGYGVMAISGSISGPLFNLLIGIGISLLKLNIANKYNSINVNFFSNSNKSNFIAYFFLILNIMSISFISKIYNFNLNKQIASVSIIIFVMYIIVVSVITFCI